MLKALALGLLLVLAGCAGVTSESNVYATLDEARAAHAIERGWVPDGLPVGTSDLREAHAGSSNWGLFSFPEAGANAVRALTGRELQADVPGCNPPGRLEWWPRILRTPFDLTKVHDTGLRIYAGRDNRTYAINWNQGKAYYWKE